MVPSKHRGHFSYSGHTCKQPSTLRPLLPNTVVSLEFCLDTKVEILIQLLRTLFARTNECALGFFVG